MQKLVWQNSSGDEIDLTSGNYGITNWEGFSNTELNIQSQQVPFQDGAVFLDSLIDQRELSVTLAMQDNGNLEERYRMRRELIHALNPKLGEGYLIYTNDFISKRIKCVAQIPLFENHNSNDSGTPKASLAWTACEPYWEDLEETVVEFTETNSSVNVENNGDIEAQLKIELFGYLKTPSIINTTNNKKIKYNGNVNGYLGINTEVGKKEVITGAESMDLTAVLPDCDSIYFSKKNKWFVIYNSNGLHLSKYTTTDGKSFNKIKTELDSLEPRDVRIKEINNKTFISYKIGNTSYIAVGDDLTVEVSEFKIIQTTQKIKDFAYSEQNLKYVAVGEGGLILTSTDFETWATQTSGTTENLNAIINSKIANKVLCVGNNNTILASSDCTTWTIQTIPTAPTRDLYSIDEGNGVILANIFKSYDGTTWILKGEEDYYAGDMFINYLGLFLTRSGEAITKTGDTYTRTNYPSTSSYLNGCAVDEENNIILGTRTSDTVSSRTFVARSFDALNWEITTAPFLWGYPSVREKDGYFYGCRNVFDINNVCILRTKDFLNWEVVYELNVRTIETPQIRVCNGTIIVFYRDINSQICGVAYSSNGGDWTSYQFDVFYRICDFIYSEFLNEYVAVGTNSQTNKAVMLKSEDLSTWTSTEYSSYTEMSSIAEMNNCLYVGGVGNNKILKSTNGTSFTEQTLPTFTYNYSVSRLYFSKTFNKLYLIGLYLEQDATYQNGIVLSSNNGTDWNILYYGLEYGVSICDNILGSKLLITSSNGYTEVEKTIISYDGNNFEVFETPEKYKPLEFGVATTIEAGFILSAGREIYELKDTEYSNGISNLANDSDINFNLAIGENSFRVLKEGGSYTMKLTYRQKYIGV